jgi:transcriptional regulator with XRE-family HTH domain
MNTIHSRIRERRLELGLSREQLGEMSGGVTYQTVGKWETEDADGGSAPKRGRLPLVARALKTTATWLLTGNSDTVNGDDVNSKYVFIPPYHSPFQQESPRVKRHHEIPAINDDEQDSYAYRRDWMAKHGFDPLQCVVVLARDDAMQLGEQCLVDLRRNEIMSGQPYALDGPGGVRLRRLFRRFDGQIIMRADNPNFPEEVAPVDQLHIIGRVVAFTGVLTA